jgi:hypothetical protein
MSLARLVLLVPFATGCIVEASGPPPQQACATPEAITVDTGATLSYTVGVDAGYYASYKGNGAWHFEWTCDTKLSASGCNFTGTIVAPPNATVTPFELEPEDSLVVTPSANETLAQFDTITTTGIDGVDIVTAAGATLQVDFFVDGLYQNQIVFFPSHGAAVNPACLPAVLTPSSP